MVFIFAMEVLVSLVFLIIAIPLERRAIEPNGLYGFRVQKTMQHPEVWYEANAFFGRRLVGVSLVALISAMILYWGFSLQPGVNLLIHTAILFAGLAWCIFRTWRFIQTL